MEPTISTRDLNKAFIDCLFKEGELPQDGGIPENAILVEGVVNKIGFHQERLEGKRDEVIKWLEVLPHQFRKSIGGGWSFLNACNQEDGIQWTGLHRDMEQLFCLGMGLGLVKCQLPREVWAALPGGVPYYTIEI